MPSAYEPWRPFGLRVSSPVFLQIRLSALTRSSSTLERAAQKDANSYLQLVSVAIPISVAFIYFSHPSRSYALLEPSGESGDANLAMSEK